MKHNFKNLNIWKLAIVIANETYLITRDFPKNEEFSLKSQLRRCAVSVPSNIAEGSSRSSNKEFNRFLEISLGSLYELQTQLIISEMQSFLTLEKFETIESKIIEFKLSADDLAFYGRDLIKRTEAGDFNIWIGGDSNAPLKSTFSVTE